MFKWIPHINLPNFSRFTFDQILGLKKVPRDYLIKRDRTLYFLSEKIRRLLSMMNYLLSAKAKLIVVMGERGSGKTSFLHHFIMASDQAWRHQKLSIYAHPDSDKKSSYIHNPDKVYINEDIPPTILIDDAQLMDSHYFEQFIKSLVQSGSKYGSVVLFLRPDGFLPLREYMDYFPHTSSVTTLQMPSLSLKETEEYLAFRVNSGGILRSMPFNFESVKRIHRNSKGIIGRINGEAYMVLKNEYHGKRKFFIFLLAIFGFFRADFLIRFLLSFRRILKRKK